MLISSPTRQQQLGISLVELMVGITIGLIVVAGASMVAVNQINEHRRLMLETQIQQDLRTAADLLQQDLRRAGYRGDAGKGVWAPPVGIGTYGEQAAQIASINPYSDITVTESQTGRSLSYSYSKTASASGSTPRNNEYSGFKWDRSTHALYIQLGQAAGQPNWQPITDPEIVKITGFQIAVNTDSTDAGVFCEKFCSPAGPSAVAPACPTLDVREVKFTIIGEATKDPNVKRTLSGIEHVRSDALTGVCPL